MAQFRAYLKRSFEREKRERRERLDDMALAFLGGKAVVTRLNQLAD